MSLIEEARELADIREPELRGRRIMELLNHHQAVMAELQRARREVIQELRQRGMNNTEIGQVLGVSRARVSQLQDSGPPPERALLGTGPLTIAVAQKKESEYGRPAVALETTTAMARLQKLATQLGLDAESEYVNPPGLIDLNRDNLIVMVGPRFSPIVSQVLESDQALKFRKTGDEWYVVDLNDEGREYHSDLEAGRDYGYVARLPRPDGQGTFLYAAGIHAVGLHGAIRYEEQELSSLYQETKGRRFSLLVASTFEPESREILTFEPATQIYRPDERGGA